MAGSGQEQSHNQCPVMSNPIQRNRFGRYRTVMETRKVPKESFDAHLLTVLPCAQEQQFVGNP